MELIMEQFPIVIQSLNVGFLQTLKLEIYHEHYCMGSQRNAADDPDADYLLFPGTGIE